MVESDKKLYNGNTMPIGEKAIKAPGLKPAKPKPLKSLVDLPEMPETLLKDKRPQPAKPGERMRIVLPPKPVETTAETSLPFKQPEKKLRHGNIATNMGEEFWNNGVLEARTLKDGTEESYENGKLKNRKLPDGTKENYANGKLKLKIFPNGNTEYYYEDGRIKKGSLKKPEKTASQVETRLKTDKKTTKKPSAETQVDEIKKLQDIVKTANKRITEIIVSRINSFGKKETPNLEALDLEETQIREKKDKASKALKILERKETKKKLKEKVVKNKKVDLPTEKVKPGEEKKSNEKAEAVRAIEERINASIAREKEILENLEKLRAKPEEKIEAANKKETTTPPGLESELSALKLELEKTGRWRLIKRELLADKILKLEREIKMTNWGNSE